MPLIRAFDAGQLGLQPSEIGVESVAAEGRRLGQFYNQVGLAKERFGERAGQEIAGAIRDAGNAYDLFETHQQVRQGGAVFSSLYNDLTQKWNDIASNSDPNDPSIAAKFRETTLEPALQKFSDQFTTEASQNWAEHHVEQLRQHFFEKTAADMSTRAGIAATVDANQTKNSLSNAVYKDTSGLDFALSMVDSTVGGAIASNPNLKDTESEKLRQTLTQQAKEQIVKSAAVGFIQRTGQLPDFLDDPKYSKYVNGAELDQFRRNVQVVQRQNAWMEKQLEVAKKTQADLAAKKQTGDILNSITTDPNNPQHLIIPPDTYKRALDVVRNNPDSPGAASDARTMIDWLQHQQNGKTEAIDNPVVIGGLMSRLTDPNNPLTEMDVLKAEMPGQGVTTRTGTILRDMVKQMGPDLLKDPLVKTAIDAGKERLGYSLAADGHERFANFIYSFLPQYLAQKRANTLPDNALDLKDPNSLISRSLKAYEPDPAQRMLMHALKQYGMTNLDALRDVTAPIGQTGTALPTKNTGFVAPSTWIHGTDQSGHLFYRDEHGTIYNSQGKPVEKKSPVVPQSR